MVRRGMDAGERATDLEYLPLVTISDIVVFNAGGLLVREDPPVLLWEDLLGPPGPTGGLDVFVPEAFTG